jgi:pilus assembly protein CpaF
MMDNDVSRLRGLHQALIQRLDLRRTDVNRMTDAQLWSYAERHLRPLLDERSDLSAAQRAQVGRQILQEVVGLGVIDDLMAD